MTTRLSDDRNLLFGILAVQLDFVSEQQLIDAMRAWILNKHGSLGSILCERGILTQGRRDLLETLVAGHIREHGNDVKQSLASVRSPESLRGSLDSMVDSPQTQMVFERQGQPSSAGPVGAPAYSLPGALPPSRFEVLRPLAEGGLGLISVANDREVMREVALKEIKPRFADHANSRSRFLLEAEITARLEHPGIVPVYGLGTYADGRPYYAMRMIRGRSMHEAIEEFHDRHDRSRLALDHDPSFRELLQRFIDVCNAVEFAHSRGIIHRDLKPANIMLGKYRETLVVDWGLAKLVDRPEAMADGSATAIDLVAESGSMPTRHGEVVGTLAFMSPEQAAGHHAKAAPATDVYCLGATLYNLLTGQVPQKDHDVPSLLTNIQQGTFPRPREIHHAVPRALEAICLKAMALRPEDRYLSATALAADVEQFLADEPVTAYRDPSARKVRRWMRKHPRTVGSLAAAVLMGIASLVVLWGATNVARHKLSVANSELQDQRNAAERSRAAAVQAQNTAVAVKEFLQDTFQSADPLQDGKSITVFEIIQRNAINQALQFQGDPRTGAEINSTIGTTLYGLGIYAEAIPLFEKAYELTVQANGPDHPDSLQARSDLYNTYVRAGRAEEVLEPMRELYEILRDQNGPDHDLTLRSMSNLASAYQSAGRWDQSLTLLENGAELARSTRGESHPATLAFVNNLAAGYLETNQVHRALPYLQDNFERISEALGPTDPGTLTARFNLANGLHAAGQLDNALREAQATLDLLTSSVTLEHPETIRALRLLQSIQLHRQDAVDAEQTIRTWLTELERQPRRDELEIASARTALAESLVEQRKLPEAARELQQVVKVLGNRPDKPTDLLRAQSVTGQILAQQEKWEDAEQRLVGAFEQLVARRHELSPSQHWYVTRACQRVIDLYRAWPRAEEADQWSERLSQVQQELDQLRDSGRSRAAAPK